MVQAVFDDFHAGLNKECLHQRKEDDRTTMLEHINNLIKQLKVKDLKQRSLSAPDYRMTQKIIFSLRNT